VKEILAYLLGLLFVPEDGGDLFLRNFGCVISQNTEMSDEHNDNFLLLNVVSIVAYFYMGFGKCKAIQNEWLKPGSYFYVAGYLSGYASQERLLREVDWLVGNL
jgi:hypothetical protein